MAGAAEFDRRWVEIARRQLAPYEQKYDTSYLAGLPHDDLIGKLKLLPRDSIVILLTVFADGTGRASIPTEMAREVASASSAPVFSPYESHLGRGVVGGHTDSFETIGNEVGDLALQILAGGTPSTLPPRPTGSNADRVDWRELKRWNISESLVPPGGEVRFRPPTLWEQYRWQMTAISAAIVLQALVIAWLLIERRRRHTAERESQQRLQEVVHLNRTATAGALSASIAHELNQPLGAILCNAEAAETLLAGKNPDLEQIRDILADIRRDDQRASDVIKHLRGLLRKRDIEFQEFDLNDAIRNTLDVLEAEAIKRGVELKPVHLQGSLQVRADPVHLQQVILNLATNAMDAMQTCAPGKRVLTMESALANESEVEVSVLDSGGGIPADKLEQYLRRVLHDQVARHGPWPVDRAHDRRDLRRPDLGGEPGRRRGRVPLHAAAREGAGAGMTELAPVIHVVDDDQSFRSSIGRLLEASGYRVALYASGDQLLRSPPGSDPGCILLDLRMAGLDGLQLQQRLSGFADASAGGVPERPRRHSGQRPGDEVRRGGFPDQARCQGDASRSHRAGPEALRRSPRAIRAARATSSARGLALSQGTGCLHAGGSRQIEQTDRP